MLKTIFLAAALVASFSQQDENDKPRPNLQEDEIKVLDPVIKTGKLPEADGPKTGRIQFRPILYTSRQGITAVNDVIFVFSPIEQPETGPARLYTDQGRARYRSTMQVPSSDAGSRRKIRIDKYKTKSIDLPGGSYALTEIIYNFWDQRSQSIIPFHYCLSEASIAFDIQNGETSYLGAIAIADLPGNRASFRKHIPIQSLDRSIETANGEAGRNEDLKLADFDGIQFEATDGICRGADYHTRAWNSKQ